MPHISDENLSHYYALRRDARESVGEHLGKPAPEDKRRWKEEMAYEHGGPSESPPPEEPDEVEHPAHYTFAVLSNGVPIECVDVLEALNLPHHLASAFEYIWRNNHKGDRILNLRKARWWLDRYINLLEDAR